jgi:hypothetical protein
MSAKVYTEQHVTLRLVQTYALKSTEVEARLREMADVIATHIPIDAYVSKLNAESYKGTIDIDIVFNTIPKEAPQ